jgi:hypothetical protein
MAKTTTCIVKEQHAKNRNAMGNNAPIIVNAIKWRIGYKKYKNKKDNAYMGKVIFRGKRKSHLLKFVGFISSKNTNPLIRLFRVNPINCLVVFSAK